MLYKYIESNSNYLPKYLIQSEKILKFLESQGILDFDAHWENYLVDSNEILYMTDFGLVLDKKFDMSMNEIELFHEIARKKILKSWRR